MYEKKYKHFFEKSDFKELPTRWFFFDIPKHKKLFLACKIAELKDGRTYLGMTGGKKNEKLNTSEKIIVGYNYR